MESVIPGFHPPNVSFTNSHFSSKSMLILADGSLLFTHQFHMLNITRLRPVVRNSGNTRSIHGDDNEKPHLSQGKTYSTNKQEILALFRRIQSSISAAESAASKVGTNNASAESVLQVLRQSRKQLKGKTPYREGSTGLSESENKQKKVERIDSVSNEGIISRPPSNFVKRSPIPSVDVERVEDDVMIATDGEDLETMKLAELKELAKSRGVKGYSKLKKAELIELLKTI